VLGGCVVVDASVVGEAVGCVVVVVATSVVVPVEEGAVSAAGAEPHPARRRPAMAMPTPSFL
jgi:hypothetical protein